MKTLLIILITAFISVCSIQAQEKGSMVEYNNTEREIPLKNLQPNKPISRSLIPQIAYAYLYNKVVTVSFEEAMPTVTIKIIKEATGETVYSQEYMNPTVISVDLTGQDSETYSIEVVSDTISLEGEFILFKLIFFRFSSMTFLSNNFPNNKIHRCTFTMSSTFTLFNIF